MKKNKNNAKRQAYAAKKEKEASKVVNWIFGVLVALGVAYAVYYTIILS